MHDFAPWRTMKVHGVHRDSRPELRRRLEGPVARFQSLIKMEADHFPDWKEVCLT